LVDDLIGVVVLVVLVGVGGVGLVGVGGVGGFGFMLRCWVLVGGGCDCFDVWVSISSFDRVFTSFS